MNQLSKRSNWKSHFSNCLPIPSTVANFFKALRPYKTSQWLLESRWLPIWRSWCICKMATDTDSVKLNVRRTGRSHLKHHFRLSFQTSNETAPPELVRGTLTTATSMQTVSTNITGSTRSRLRPSAAAASSARRPPSPDFQIRERLARSRDATEDRVADNRNSYDNPAMDISSASSPQDGRPDGHLPPVKLNGQVSTPAPYTISYSRVIWMFGIWGLKICQWLVVINQLYGLSKTNWVNFNLTKKFMTKVKMKFQIIRFFCDLKLWRNVLLRLELNTMLHF